MISGSVMSGDDKSTRQPAAGQRRPRAAAPPGGSVYCACHAKGSQEAICTAPATRQPAAGQRRPRAPQLFLTRLCVLRLPRERQPGSSLYCACHAKASRGPAAPTRAAAPPGGSVYCACYAKASRGPAAPPRAAAPPAGRRNLFIGTFFFPKGFFFWLFRILFEEAFDVLILGVCKIHPPVHQVTDDVRIAHE